MQSQLHPYLGFRGNAREAMEFYQSVFGGKLLMNTFKEYQASSDPSEDNKIMHSQLDVDNGISFMASDIPKRMDNNEGLNPRLSLSGDNEKELTTYFEKLSTGGMITQPLVKSQWGDTFGMLIDRYGVNWMVNISAPKA
ncbi:MAG TPA: VOC family protein [Anaerolineaceae bacterium]|nr:VOC family protein [Anaerolineaceae bacterium]